MPLRDNNARCDLQFRKWAYQRIPGVPLRSPDMRSGAVIPTFWRPSGKFPPDLHCVAAPTANVVQFAFWSLQRNNLFRSDWPGCINGFFSLIGCSGKRRNNPLLKDVYGDWKRPVG